MKCIGLTGQAGSGKSTVARLFQGLGIPLIQADEINRQLLIPHQFAYEAIVKHFGSEVLNPDATLNKAWLRETIIRSPKHRQWLEDLLHPLIQTKIKHQIQQLSEAPYCLIEIPLLITQEKYPYIQRILLVRAPLSDQIHRLVQRDAISPAQAQALIQLQPNLATYLKHSHDVIDNNQDLAHLKQEILQLDQLYRI